MSITLMKWEQQTRRKLTHPQLQTPQVEDFIRNWVMQFGSSTPSNMVQSLRESIGTWLRPPHSATICSLCAAPLLWAQWPIAKLVVRASD